MSGIRDWTIHSPDAEPCYLVVMADGSLCSVHRTSASADTQCAVMSDPARVIQLPYFRELPKVSK